jgi:four helix bundle protein
MNLAVVTYEVAKRLPRNEQFELALQMRRASVSIPSNVAEGHAFRTSPKSYLRYVRIALGSLAELDTHLELAVRLDLADPASLEPVRKEVARTGQLLHGLLRALARKQNR